MKARTLYNRRKMFIACLISLALLTGVCVPPSFSNVYTIEAQANPLVPIGGFLGKLGTNITLAETIISSLLSAGAGVTNTAWLNQLNSAYGTAAFSIGEMYSQGLFEVVEDAATGAYTIIDNGFIDAVESVSAYHNLGIDTLFEVTAEDQSIIPGIAAASGGTTLLKTILGGVTLGTVGAAAAAVAGGVAVGVLAYHVYQKWQSHINSGTPIDINAIIPSGSIYIGLIERTGTSHLKSIYFSVEDSVGYHFINTNNGYNEFRILKNKGAGNNIIGQVVTINMIGNEQTSQSTTNIRDNTAECKSVYISPENTASYDGWTETSQSGYDSLKTFANDGNLENRPVYSPDLIGKFGNATGEDRLETPLQDDEGLKFVPWSDYIDDFVGPANTNTEDNLPEDNEDVFRDFISPYITPVDETPTPSPTIPQPTNPEDITSNPITNPVPEQPDYDDKPELTTEDIADASPYTTPNLLDKFPFCIPKDIHDLFAVLSSGSRQAPRIKFDYVSEYFDYELHIDIDLAAFNDAAAIFRLLELILFILGLALATKNLIRW